MKTPAIRYIEFFIGHPVLTWRYIDEKDIEEEIKNLSNKNCNYDAKIIRVTTESYIHGEYKSKKYRMFSITR